MLLDGRRADFWNISDDHPLASMASDTAVCCNGISARIYLSNYLKNKKINPLSLVI
jgi:hypothetical protein